ncbi:MAG: response regulator [Phycisphaerales bacterium]|nr:MAG: response regulator [Phycisphaerales bacterium]
MKADKRVLTTGEVAKICSVAPRTVSKWFDQGHLRGYRIPGSKDRRIPLDQLVRFMRLHNIPLNGLDQEELHVVILDNDVAFSEILANALQENGGYGVTVTTCAFEAGAVVRETKPQAVIIDVSLLDVDAKKISRFIRSQGELKAIKIIGIAEHLDQGRGQALLQVGFDAYLSKPFDMQSLLRLLESGAAVY